MVALIPITGHLHGPRVDREPVSLPGPGLVVSTLRPRRGGNDPSRATAVIGDLEAAAFIDGRVRPHEQVHAGRVAELADELAVAPWSPGPVSVTHPPSGELTAIVERTTARPPARATTTSEHEVALWTVTDHDELTALSRAVGALAPLYLVDGHHRVAATVAAAERRVVPSRVLSAFLASDQLRVRAFHRRLRPAPDPAMLTAVADEAGVARRRLEAPREPNEPGEVVLAAPDGWWAATLPEGDPRGGVAAMDVCVVERTLLQPLAARDPAARVEPVAPPADVASVGRDDALTVLLHPLALEEVLRIADAGDTVPPKTTYLEPKLPRDLLHVARELAGAPERGPADA